MATQRGKVQDFRNVHLVVFPGFRYDAFETGGISVAWQGDAITVSIGPDNIPVYVSTGVSYGILTVNLQGAADGIDFTDTWLRLGVPKLLSLKDSNGKTFLTEAKALPRQRANIAYNATANPYIYDIHCPNFSGPMGSLNNS